jgi:hypothetical protein
MQFKDYYSILGVNSSATQTEIKKAFHKKAMEYHPDRNAWFKEESEKKMKEINEAYEALSDSDKRRIYDYEYYESKWSENTSEKKEKSSSESKAKERKENNKSSQDKTSQAKTPPKPLVNNNLFVYLSRFWSWSMGIFRSIPIIGQVMIIIILLWGFASAYESIFPEEEPYPYTSTTYRTTSPIEPNNNTVSRANSGTVNDMFAVYCGLNRLFALHSIAPESKYYKRLVENNSDVSSQIAIAPRLVAERSIIWIPGLIEDISDTTWPFKDSLSILKESDERLLRFLENMNYIQSVDDFKKNMIADYAVSVNLLNGFPEVFAREYDNYPNQSESNASVLIVNGSMMCNGNADISFWDSWLSEVNATSEELGSRRIMQDANFRKTPWTNGEILRPLIKGDYVTVMDKKKVGSMEWYQVSQYNTTGWVSYLAFIDDPSKASAADCDPINGYIDDNWYCSCKEWYKWMGSVRACVLKSTISWEKILSEMEINIATCWMGGYISKYTKKCQCDYAEWYWMGSNGKCEKR